MRGAVVCIMALFAVEASGAARWIRVSSPSIQLFTDCGEETAQTILHHFDTLHRAFGESHIAASPAPLPLLVFVFASPDEFKKYITDPNSAKNSMDLERMSMKPERMYQSNGDDDLIVLYQEGALQRLASSEYLLSVVAHSSAALPRWMVEGVSQFYSTLSVSGNKVHIGKPIPPYQQLLGNEPWLSPHDLAVGNRSDEPIFRAETWALVHMLTLAPAWSKGMPQFVKLLNEGHEQEEAFTTAFGRPIRDALTELHTYVRFPREMTEPAPPAESVPVYQVTRLSVVDATLALADLALRTDHLELARTLFTRAAKENPQSPDAAAGLGGLALAEHRDKDAEREFERAITMGSRNPTTYFQLALLKKDRALLEKTLTIDPHFSEAHFLLGVRETDDGNFTSAIEHLRQAIAVQPRRFTYWNALGYAQAKSGDRPGVAESARQAALAASTPEQQQMAAALTQLASEAPVVATKKPDVIMSPSWQNPKGDTHAEGTLTRMDCDSRPPRLFFSIGTPARTIELKVEDPTKVEMVNAGGVSTTLNCGEQSQAVAVEYIAASGEITRIEFKRDINR